MLKGKNAIVTGSTSGIGEAIATALATAGCNVMINGFGKPEEINALKEALAKLKVKVGYSDADMSKPEAIQKMVEDTADTFGSVDILVNNAGIQFTAPVDQFPDDKWNAILAINLSASFHTIKHTLPIMRQARWGRIVNTISVHGLVASKDKVAYVAAKHGLVGLTRTVALETAQDGITCNGICPGWVLTPLVEKQIRDKAQQEGKDVAKAKQELVEEKQPTQQFVKPEDIAALAVFLCGPNSSSITGSAITIDGGWTAE